MTSDQWLRVLRIAREDAARIRANHGIVLRPPVAAPTTATPSERTARAKGRGS